jgi:CDP-glucose 4,6-dehydratase
MEKLGLMKLNKKFWENKRVLITGHTGFKGSWLCIWLQSLNAEVFGLALKPNSQLSLFYEAGVGDNMTSIIGDIRDLKTVVKAIEKVQPEIIIHMAAQPLVLYSYDNPIETYSTNVMGTVNVLEAARKVPCVKVVINVTTDKCYENKEWIWSYRENEPMGGFDPYSSSKGCSELITSAYRQSFYLKSEIGLASARSGNVIGGGDWSKDRLIPDILRAFENSQPVMIRNKSAIRPWQHVLDALSGYLMLAEKLYNERSFFSDAWNFGPLESDSKSVEWIVQHMVNIWGKGACWSSDVSQKIHEANLLRLDTSKANRVLGWYPNWGLEEALEKVINWHLNWLEKKNIRLICLEQIESYELKSNNISK